ncbi:MAG: hypothetical protein ACRDJP_01735, partial [Actinomycetota bacterium]
MTGSARLASATAAVVLAVAGLTVAVPTIVDDVSSVTPAGKHGPGASLDSIPFIENRGQVDDAVRYYLYGSSGVGFTTDGLRMLAAGRPVELSFEDARPVSPQAQVPAETVVSYFRGDRDEWRTGVPTYERVVYREPWQGID